MPFTASIKKNGAYVALASAALKLKAGGAYVSAVDLRIKAAGIYTGSGVVPANTVAPSIAGTASVGSTLTCTAGTWTGTPTPTITREWLRGSNAIPGATALTYVVENADKGFQVSVLERATNSIGSITRQSNVISIPA